MEYITFLYIAQFKVDGDWSEWTTWDDCSTTCGSGKKARTRICNNPTPTMDFSAKNQTPTMDFNADPFKDPFKEETPYLNEGFSEAIGLNKSERSMDKLFSCRFCMKRFSQKGVWKRHEKYTMLKNSSIAPTVITNR